MAWDVLGFGCAAVDDLLYVDAFPMPDDKTRVTSSQRQCGGLGATALVAAARCGARCAYAGVLGNDALSTFVSDTLAAEGIDVSTIVRDPKASPVHSVIVVSRAHHTRNIFFDVSGLMGAHDTLPDAHVVRSAKVVFLDHYGMAGNIRVAQIARSAGIPIVADIERDDVPRFGELLPLVDHLVLSRDFAQKLASASTPAEAAVRLWNPARQAVVVTCGDQGCWYVDAANPAAARHFPAFKVDTVDTTGCGDVFHGAYAAALARGLPLLERLRLASAAAAIKATQPGGQSGIPHRAALDEFLQKHTVPIDDPR